MRFRGFRTSEREAERELLDPGDCECGAVLSQRATGDLIVESTLTGRGVGIEAYRVGSVENLPCELQVHRLVQLPHLRQTRVDIEVAVAAILIPLSSLTRVWQANGTSRSEAVVYCIRIGQDLGRSIDQVEMGLHHSGLHCKALLLPVRCPSWGNESEG